MAARTLRSTIGALGASSLLVLAACADGDASAQTDEAISLRSNDWNAPIHPFNTAGWEPLAEELEERTDGQVTLQHFPSEGLGAVGDTLDLLRNGQADLASTTVAYHPAQLPLLQITGGTAWEDAALSAQAMWEMCQMEPFRSELLDAGMVPILCTSVSPYELLLNNGPIEGIPEAFENQRIRALGLQARIIERLGSTTTSDPSPEIYLRMEQGSIDGLTAGWYTLPALSLAEVTTHATIGLASWNAGMVLYGVSTETWDSWPEDVKDVFRELGPELSLAVAEGIDDQDAEAQDSAEGSIEIYEVSAEERAVVTEAVDEALTAWVEETGATLGLEDEAQQAFDVLVALRDLERLPAAEWTPSSY